MMRKLGKKCNIEDVHPHRMRRTLCCSLLDRGMPIQEVKEVLGHQNIDTTMIYTYMNPKIIKYKHNIYS